MTNGPDDAPFAAAKAPGPLFVALYAELHRVARREAHRWSPQMALGTTTLLHETYLQLSQREELSFATRPQFMAYAARAMRHLAIDHARQRRAAKRGGDAQVTSIDTQDADTLCVPDVPAGLVDALDALEALDAELALVVDLRFFCGFSMAEIASMHGVTERTVQRRWEKARLLLFRALDGA